MTSLQRQNLPSTPSTHSLPRRDVAYARAHTSPTRTRRPTTRTTTCSDDKRRTDDAHAVGLDASVRSSVHTHVPRGPLIVRQRVVIVPPLIPLPSHSSHSSRVFFSLAVPAHPRLPNPHTYTTARDPARTYATNAARTPHDDTPPVWLAFPLARAAAAAERARAALRRRSYVEPSTPRRGVGRWWGIRGLHWGGAECALVFRFSLCAFRAFRTFLLSFFPLPRHRLPLMSRPHLTPHLAPHLPCPSIRFH